jgi:predicted RNase H-like HicB family nuclease
LDGLDRLRYRDAWFHVKWEAREGEWLAYVPLVPGLSAVGRTRWEAFSELNRRLYNRMEAAIDRALLRETTRFALL